MDPQVLQVAAVVMFGGMWLGWAGYVRSQKRRDAERVARRRVTQMQDADRVSVQFGPESPDAYEDD
jgi:hypothetical protein